MLRQLRGDDIHELFSLRTNAEINRFLDRAVPGSLDDVESFIKIVNHIILNNEGLYWAIAIKDKIIGSISLRNFDAEECRAEIGYELHPDYQGQGIMNEAINDVLTYAFEQIGLREITAQTVPENAQSINLLQKHGFVKSVDFEGAFVLTKARA